MANNWYTSTTHQILRATTKSYRNVPIRIESTTPTTTTDDFLVPRLLNHSSAYHIKCPSMSDEFVFGNGDSGLNNNLGVDRPIFFVHDFCLTGYEFLT